MPTQYCRKCGAPTTTSGDERAEVERLWREGNGIMAICRAVGRSKRTVYRILEPLRHPEEPGQLRLALGTLPPLEA